MAVHPLCRDEKRRGERGDDRIEGSALQSRGGPAMSASSPPPLHKSAVEEMHTIPICLPAVPPLARARRGVMGVLALMAPGGGAVQCISNRSDPPPPPPLLLHSAQSGAAEKMTSELTLCIVLPFPCTLLSSSSFSSYEMHLSSVPLSFRIEWLQ